MSASAFAPYLLLGAFEFRVSPKFAVGVNVCTLSFSSITMKDKGIDDYYFEQSSINLSLNISSVSAKFYF